MGVSAIAELMLPQWYLKAFLRGVSQEKRREMVRDMCLKEAQEEAVRQGGVVPDNVAEEAVALTYEMYEFSLSLG